MAGEVHRSMYTDPSSQIMATIISGICILLNPDRSKMKKKAFIFTLIILLALVFTALSLSPNVSYLSASLDLLRKGHSDICLKYTTHFGHFLLLESQI